MEISSCSSRTGTRTSTYPAGVSFPPQLPGSLLLPRSIWAEGETDRLVSLIRTKVASSASPSSTDSELASAIAQTAVNFARMVSFRKDAYTPFCAEAKRWKIRGMDRGGKVDDVTVVVAIVRKQDGEEEGKQ